MKRTVLSILLLLGIQQSNFGQFYKSLSSSEIQLGIQKLNVVGSVLYIAAHPDDENTRLLAYLAKEKKLRTGYLSITRGDGGQNLIGNEQSELLGLIRTQELLAARRIDGAEQFFTRANDFGFSKNPEETFTIWNRDTILADVVWVIRKFQPDIVITRFPTDGSGGHGHHTASAMLAEQAIEAAADPKRFPEQLSLVSIWRVKRLVWNGFNFGGRPQSDGKEFTKIDIGVYNPLLGKGYGEIASLSRSQHRSQGFGVPMQRGSNSETFKFILGDSLKTSIFDGCDFSWKRINKSQKIQDLITLALKNYSSENPANSVDILIKLNDAVKLLEDSYWKVQKEKEIQELILACAGFFIDVNADQFFIYPNGKIKINLQTINRSDVNIELKELSFLDFDTITNIPLIKNNLFSFSKQCIVPKGSPYSNPYWLKQKHAIDRYEVASQKEIGIADNPFSLFAKIKIKINGKDFIIEKGVSYKWTDPVKGELYRQLEVLPLVSINALAKNVIFNAQENKVVSFTIHSNTEKAIGKVILNSTKGYTITPAFINFNLANAGDETILNFSISAPSDVKNASEIINPIIEIYEEKISVGINRIQYDHIPIQTLISPAEVKLEKFDLQIRGKKIGYINGAGDQVAECLRQIGYLVDELTEEQLVSGNLQQYDAIVAGVRAYNTNEKLKYYYNPLMEYVKNGGNYIVQYNTNNFLSAIIPEIGPYPFKVGRDRVTEEKAEMRIINKEHSILNYPNKITPADFDNWIQERGLYFVNNIDSRYETVFSCNDPGEKANEGSLIICKYGKGTFTYTGLSFFRELPAGVSGAYRLFVNLLDQGKK